MITIRETPFDPWQETLSYQQERLGNSGKFGATASFIGTMRDFNEGDDVTAMTLEHYPGMTERQLAKIVDEAKTQWDFIDSLIIHRVGALFPNDPIVLVVIWSAHRGAAFDACRFIMEALKSKAPFWKKESLSSSERWVGKNTDGYVDSKPFRHKKGD